LSGPEATALGLSSDLLSLSGSEFESAAAVRFGAVTRVVNALLTSAVEAAGMVIVLEDLHWADEASLQLVRHVSAGVSVAPLLVLATSRDPLPDSVTGLAGSSIMRDPA
jgi:predicted ATPase